MKERARKKLDKALDRARSKAANPGRPLGSVLADLGGVLARCGEEPYEGCEEIAAGALAVMALAHLRLAEEHLVVKVIRKSAGLSSVEEGIGGDSWPGLADKAAEFAQKADAIPAGGAAYGRLLDAMVSRAGEVGEEQPEETRNVEYPIYSPTIFVPEGYDTAAYMARGLSRLKAKDLREYAAGFPDGDRLMSAMGFGG